MEFPVSKAIPELRAALAEGNQAILQAPPGAGKTTLVPLELLAEPWLRDRKIIILEPRRLAARAAARRMAAMREEPVGKTIGYRVRLESCVSAATRIEVVTEAILTRMLQEDPELPDVALLIFDEFHERSLHADLGLALARDVQGSLRPDLRLLIMSATIDTARLSEQLDQAIVVTAAGRSFPVETIHRPVAANTWLEQHVSRVVHEALAAHDGSILVFLPGAGEIRRVHQNLQGVSADTTIIAPLYGALPQQQQDQAIAPAPAGKRKVVLATDIAESSLTIEGIAVVIDAGRQRLPQFDPNSGMTRLETRQLSRASADQRRGRAGRLGPGVCYRLWSPAEDRALVAQTAPEIQSADLAGLVLELAHWGIADPAKLKWIDPPPEPSVLVARELLQQLAALDERGRITGHGKEMLALGTHPRLAHMLICARDLGHGYTACCLAALVSDRDVIKPDGPRCDTDIATRLDAMAAVATGGSSHSPSGRLDRGACRARLELAKQMRRRLKIKSKSIESDSAGLLLAFAYADRIGRRRERAGRTYLLANGRGAVLPQHDQLGRHDFIVVADLDAANANAGVFLAAAIDRDEIETHFAKDINQTQVIAWDEGAEAVRARRQTQYRSITLRDAPLAKPDGEEVLVAMLNGIRSMGLTVLPWNKRTEAWRHRVLFLRRLFPEEWPDVTDRALALSLEQWLGPFLQGMTRREQLSNVDLATALHTLLDYQQQRRLDELAPTHLVVPSGVSIPLDYGLGDTPILPVRIQQMFGAPQTPCIAGGRVPILLHLLSPANRPVQVTTDLESFWTNTYDNVRKELRGRYPKHPWPDDPRHATPTNTAKRRS